MFMFGLAAAVLVMMLMAGRHWSRRHAIDMGTMSSQWLAEYNAQHP